MAVHRPNVVVVSANLFQYCALQEQPLDEVGVVFKFTSTCPTTSALCVSNLRKKGIHKGIGIEGLQVVHSLSHPYKLHW